MKVGSLGTINFGGGIHAYVGSAQNNLGKRTKRHLGTRKNQFWHIDYFLGLKSVRILEVLIKSMRELLNVKLQDA